MTRQRTILGHLVGWGLSRRYEDAATEGLVYVLGRTVEAGDAFLGMLRQLCPELPGPLRYRTQEASEEGRPDVVGTFQGVRRVVIENKFWAGLTGNQPVGYLRELERAPEASVLIVVAPRQRGPWLWREIEARLRAEDDLTLEPLAAPRDFEGAVRVGSTSVGVTNWTHVLARLREGLNGDRAALADLEQLEGLCEVASEDEALPLSADELADQRIPRQLLQVGRIAEAVFGRVDPTRVHLGRASRLTADWVTMGRYIYFGTHASPPWGWLGIDLNSWQLRGRTPLWIHLVGDGIKDLARVEHEIKAWAQARGHIADEMSAGGLIVSVDIAPGREPATVVEQIVGQLHELSDLVLRVSAGAGSGPPGEGEGA